MTEKPPVSSYVRVHYAAVLITIALLATMLGASRQWLAGLSIWPDQGQAAVAVTVEGRTRVMAHDDDAPAPIASMAKVMTAYVVLVRHPLQADQAGYRLAITGGDVMDTRRRAALGQSVVAVHEGQRLTQRQALDALLLASANNVAAVLAAREAGSGSRFVEWMNRQARLLGMADTRYTDPSGYDAATVSTAADQVRLARAAMALPAFARIVGQRTARFPSTGTIRNTDKLLGQDGFVGIKTGSLAAAGGCFMFQNERTVQGRRVVVVGVVMGQRSRELVTAGQTSARRLVFRIDQQLRDGTLSAVH